MAACFRHRALRNPAHTTLVMSAAFGVALALAMPAALAQQARSIYNEQGELVRGSRAIGAVGTDLFGDKVSLYTGSIEFVQNDVSLPGNSALPVAVGRRLIAGGPLAGDGHFGKWDLEIPHLHGVFSREIGGGWTSVNGAAPQQRCDSFGKPVSTWDQNRQSTWNGDEFWNGTFLYVPGMGDQEILRRSVNNALAPTDGQQYRLVTRQHWQFRCLNGLANDPSANKAMGQGFVAVSPDGTVYQFDHMVSRATSSLEKPVLRALGAESISPGPGAEPMTAAASPRASATMVIALPPPSPDQAAELILRRAEYKMLPTRITDRFGNTVTYVYDAADPWKLLSITANDAAGSPRALTFTYVTGSHQIATVSDGSRVWRYSYSGTGINAVLSTVTLPDNSAWQLAGVDALLNDFSYQSEQHPGCDGAGMVATVDMTGTMTHPSGATGSFTLRPVMHGRAGVWRQCVTERYGERSRYPNFFVTNALVSKTISGAGVTPMTWETAYAAPVSSWDPCNGCVASTTTEVTEPGGARKRYTFGTLFRQTEGQLQQVEVIDANGAVLQSALTQYQDPASGTWPSPVGYSDQQRGDGELASRPEIVNRRTISQQGVDFSWTANSFDNRGRPLAVTRASTLGYARSETTAYWDNTAKWILGQVASVTEGSTGATMLANGYDANVGTLTSVSHFGHADETMRYYADGTLATRSDGLGNTTTYSNYKRGLAQHIAYPDGATQSAVLNIYGAITSTADPYGYVTEYGYDAMGRLASVSLGAGDTVAWNQTTISFQQVNSTAYDLAASHWRQDITTGNARTSTYFDALWRPVYTYSADLANPGATSRLVKRGYDFAGRTTFESYPERNDTLFKGVTTTYDALGRSIQTSAASELGELVSTSSFGAGFQKIFTDARGHTSVTSYQAFDQPAEAVTNIAAPEGVNVAITRDVFGKPTAITRSGGGKSATRNVVYDGYQRLCKTIEPETGATVLDYDGANNVVWRASGLNLPSGACDRASVAAAGKITFGYDALNRLTTTTYGDASASIVRTYTLDGLPLTISADGSVWTNTYNKRRLNERESLAYGGTTYNISRAYDANASLSQLTYPDGSALAYSPNALGEAQQVGAYASGIHYHPNGAIAGFRYGNGVMRSLTQNTRLLPQTATDTGALNDLYSYDANGNVVSIVDQNWGSNSRTMGYDGLDRLTSVAAPSLWGSATYSYDALDNLTGNTITGGATARSVAFHYPDPATNLLMTASGSAGYNFAYAYDSQGNLVERDGKQYRFDQGNRMSAAVGVATYRYDGLGHRVSVVGSDGVNRIGLYSQGGQLLQSGPAGAAATRYIYLHKHVLAEAGPAGTQYQHTDALGSPIARTDGAGALVSQTKYEPYGKTAQGATPTLGFTGHVNDADTALVYMQQRYYDPVAGRFLSVDPVVTDANSGIGFNRYAYVNNGPYKYIDPDGRFPWGIVVGVAVEIGIEMGVEGKSFRELDVTNIIVAGAIGAVAPGVGSSMIRGYQTGSKVSTALKAITKLQSKAANTTNRAQKILNKIDEHATKITEELAEAGKTAAQATGGVVVKKIAQDEINRRQEEAKKKEAPPPPPIPTKE